MPCEAFKANLEKWHTLKVIVDDKWGREQQLSPPFFKLDEYGTAFKYYDDFVSAR